MRALPTSAHEQFRTCHNRLGEALCVGAYWLIRLTACVRCLHGGKNDGPISSIDGYRQVDESHEATPPAPEWVSLHVCKCIAAKQTSIVYHELQTSKTANRAKGPRCFDHSAAVSGLTQTCPLFTELDLGDYSARRRSGPRKYFVSDS